MNPFNVLYKTETLPLLQAINDAPELWNAITGRTQGESPHREAPDIWVRYNSYDRVLAEPARANNEHIPVWYPAYKKLKPYVDPILFDLMRRVDGEILGGVLITKVPAGCKVYPHFDRGWHVDYYDKFYVQLSGAHGCDFAARDPEGNVHVFSPRHDDVYLFDNRMEHWVHNNSEIDRVTLIACIRTQMFGRK